MDHVAELCHHTFGSVAILSGVERFKYVRFGFYH
jgi:hypothetical protein